ncbi:P27 family phage terminase small subunit [Gordonia sp. QH-12]|uniref:P27 family phage terminase small subunit n=1 Tax=Gordonia sp. QH-12 TaxID=1437876 RepID=UPI0007849C97|nr:P27 family phage terminase small subunit [Gordonia sp. QH-12]
MGSSETPSGLGTKGLRIWTDAVGEFDLTEAQLVILEGACRQADQIDELYDQLAKLDGNYRVRGSMGQPTAAPELDQIRKAQAEMRTALASIGLTKPQDAEQAIEPAKASGVVKRASFKVK